MKIKFLSSEQKDNLIKMLETLYEKKEIAAKMWLELQEQKQQEYNEKYLGSRWSRMWNDNIDIIYYMALYLNADGLIRRAGALSLKVLKRLDKLTTPQVHLGFYREYYKGKVEYNNIDTMLYKLRYFTNEVLQLSEENVEFIEKCERELEVCTKVLHGIDGTPLYVANGGYVYAG